MTSSKVASDDAWGSEDDYFSRPPTKVNGDASWIATIGFWMLLFLNLILGIIAGFADCFIRSLASVGKTAAEKGRPLYFAPTSWWYNLGMAIRLLVKGKKSRFVLFNQMRNAFGGGDWWWHGEGAWSWRHEAVRQTMASDQKRTAAFGAVTACCPEAFPPRMLLFVDGSEWSTVRSALIEKLTAKRCWEGRLPNLAAAMEAKLKPAGGFTLATLDKTLSDNCVAFGVWYLLFGVELTPEQCATVAAWGASGLAGVFVFPRLLQRIAFNQLLKRITKLRKDTLAVAKAHGLQDLLVSMNESLGEYKRPTAVEFSDELMYAVNFAGVGGTSHGCWNVSQFLRGEGNDVPLAGLGADVPATTFPPKEKLPGLFKSNPTAFIKESVRIDAPVTSATCVFKEDTEIDGINMSCCGKPGKLCVKAGTMHQYVLSMANRDPAVFDNPNAFDPARPNLDKMLGWNGALDDPSKYPRICPGQELSVAVIHTVISLVKEVADAQIV